MVVPQTGINDFEGDTVLVSQIQGLLLYLGYKPGSSDGLAGPRTYSAITKFEKDGGGVPAGEISDDLLYRLERRKLIFRVQSMLQVLGFDPGPADGKAGSETIRAVKAFEQAQGIEATGEVTDEMLGRLIDTRTKD
jgi:peptidoglycan hydrolase-like protein with peptidoglycan-binding domain